MPPKLYMIPASPPARAVLMCAEVLGIELELVPVDLLKGEHLTEAFLKKNPQHTIPLLEDNDGFIVSDSHVIMSYLVAKYGKDDLLYPKNDIKQRSIIDQRLYFDAGILFARGLLISRKLFFHGIQPTQEGIDFLKEGIEILDRLLADSRTSYIAGDSLSIADFSIIATITSWDVLVPLAGFSNIVAYLERIKKLQFYNKNVEGLQMFKTVIGAKLDK